MVLRRVSELPRFTVGRAPREEMVDSRVERRRTSDPPSDEEAPELLIREAGLWATAFGESSFFSRAGLTLFLR